MHQRSVVLRNEEIYDAVTELPSYNLQVVSYSKQFKSQSTGPINAIMNNKTLLNSVAPARATNCARVGRMNQSTRRGLTKRHHDGGEAHGSINQQRGWEKQ